MAERNAQSESIQVEQKENTETYSKRRFLQQFSIFGGGMLGLRKAVQKVRGSEPNGVPLVLTTDGRGNPDRVKYVPEERKRRIEVFDSYDISNLQSRYPFVKGMSLEYSQDPTDIRLKFHLKENTYSNRKVLPSSIKRVPVVFTQCTTDSFTPLADRSEDRYDIINGNINCGVLADGAYNRGTLSVAGYESSSGQGAILTAGHITYNRDNNEIYQPYDGPDRGYSDDGIIGQLIDREGISSSELDWAIYQFDSPTRGMDPRATEYYGQNDITGAWTYQGITNEVDPVQESGPKAQFTGIHTTATGCEAVQTLKNRYLEREVRYQSDYGVQNGDSGGTFVDSDGKLMSHLSGTVYSDTINNGSDVAVGAPGQNIFDSAGFSLYP